jgi:hypothetical protein
MTIIGADGKAIEFAGTDGVVIDRRSADRRAVEHIVPERREQERREAKPKSAAKDWRDNLEGRNIQARMEDLLRQFEVAVGIS